MNNTNAFDAGATIVDASKVDLRLPQAPPPIFYRPCLRSGVDEEVREQIRRFIGEGDIIEVADQDVFPKYCIFVQVAGQVQYADFTQGIERCFRKHGTEACVFEYCPIQKQFIGRAHDYFVTARIQY